MRSLFTMMLLLMLAVLLCLAGGGAYLWFKVDDWVDPVLHPYNQVYAGYSIVPEKVPGLRLTPLEVTGWDGGEMTVFIVERGPEGEETSNQLAVLGDLTSTPANRLSGIDYVLVCVDWDYGIRSALPLAEYLTAAGLRCVLWEPRGADNRRRDCTHGLRECEDVPLIIDALAEASGKESPIVVGVGQGYGAGLLLQAAAREPRIGGLVAVDSFTSLREAVGHTLPQGAVKPVYSWFIDFKLSSLVGYESFDVAPVESAARLDRNVPVLVVNLAQDSPLCTLKDAITIYRQLPSDHRNVWTLSNASDPPDAKTRTFSFMEGKENKQRKVSVDVDLLRDVDVSADVVWISVIHWMNDVLVDSLESPRVRMPERPVISPSRHL